MQNLVTELTPAICVDKITMLVELLYHICVSRLP